MTSRAVAVADRPLRVAHVSFNADQQDREAEALLDAWPTLLGVAGAVARAGAEVTVVQAASRHQILRRDNVDFQFVHDPAIASSRAAQRFVPGASPRRMIAAVAASRPDVVHVQGMPFALATHRLASALPGVPVLVQDHASTPPRVLRSLAWRWCYRSVSGIVVAAREHADAYRVARAIPAHLPVFEVIEGSTDFTPGDRSTAREATGLSGNPCLLWTGHLNENKDPLTTLAAFRLAIQALPDARLWCCFSRAPLLEPVQRFIAGSRELASRVVLLGRRPHAEMEYYFRAADFFVQMSRREGCSYSTIEAMACGATPLVTDIASNRRIVGDAGSLTPVGDASAMAEAMVSWARHERESLRRAARARFGAALSYDVIGRDLLAAYRELCSGQ